LGNHSGHGIHPSKSKKEKKKERNNKGLSTFFPPSIQIFHMPQKEAVTFVAVLKS